MRSSYFMSEPLSEQQHREALARGERICRECGGTVIPPKRNWCSRECIHAYNSRIRRVREVIWERDQGKCALCPAVVGNESFPHHWEADHIVPLVEGGLHTPDNIRTLCIPCHKAETKKLTARRFQREANP